jgi:hypothetical protein
MATNERVDYTSNDLYAGQQAASQSLRTNFTPGKATGQAGDMNWPTDFRIPQGTPAFDGESAGPVEMSRSRVVKLGRNIVCDQVIAAPTVESIRVEAASDPFLYNGTDTVQETEYRDDIAGEERKTGGDRIAGA